MSNPWKLEDAPSQSGRVAIVTGANSGLGFETALALAGKGATVVLACRNMEKAETAQRDILAKYPHAKVQCLPLDTSSLASVRAFAERFAAAHDRCDLLINDAGIMMSPYQLTADGFENQFATNYLGHFLSRASSSRPLRDDGHECPLQLPTTGSR